MVLERLLQTAGFQVRVAENGAGGSQDVSASGGRSSSGWTCECRSWMVSKRFNGSGLWSGGRDVKIAAVTASGLDSQRKEVLAAGLDDYVSKPYRPDEIFDCMARHLGVRYRRAEADAPTVG